jgi:multidrug efflux pump subunit AcrA (membrane-fusion protein)
MNVGNNRKWLIIPPVILGVMVVAYFRSTATSPTRRPPSETVRVLRVIEAQQVDVVPRVLGYGTARPAQVWRAIAEVRGRVTAIPSELKPGAFLAVDDVVLRIDPREYELQVAQLDAQITQEQSRLHELTTQADNDRASLTIEKSSLALAQHDLEHVEDLSNKAMAPDTELRSQQRRVLAQQQKVQSLENALNLVPGKRETLEATIAVLHAKLEQARLDLEKTIIRSPIRCRIGEVAIETGQFLQAGELLFEADGVAVTEVDVQIPMDRARNLLRAVEPQMVGEISDMNALHRMFDLTATVTMRVGDLTVNWDARFIRIREQLNPVTRTIGIIVAVDEPYEQAIPGQRPPLLPGTFCEVELRGRAVAASIIVPRAALHDGHVFIVDPDNRLRRRAVDVLFSQADFACLERGLSPAERVIISDPVPAIEGMLITPIIDAEWAPYLLEQAAGKAVIR